MKIAIFDDDYPDDRNIPGDMFAHTRARFYQMKGHDVLVFRRAKESCDLAYENIKICDCRDAQNMLERLERFAPDANAVHFAAEPFISEISPKLKAPLFVWVHGYEALGWYRKTYDMRLTDWYPHRIMFRHQRSQMRLASFSKLIDRAAAGERIKFIFVSSWMKEVCEADTRRSILNFEIVPNPIDTERFKPSGIVGKERNLLVIRSSNSYKYAPDMVSQVIRKLMQPYGHPFRCRIFSDGALFDKFFAPLAQIAGVELHKGFLPQDEIAKQHAWGGIFLCPTRQDAQGVSMCEAMSSGLVIATNPVTAIPEFATQEFAMLSKTASQLVRDIEDQSSNSALMEHKSRMAAEYVRHMLSAEAVCEKELGIMKAK